MRKLGKILMTFPLVLVFSMYMFAQGGGGGGAGGAAGGASAGQSGGGGAPTAGSNVGTSTSEAPPAQGAVRAGTHANKTLTGCIQSSGNEYMLQEDNGKIAMLAGESVSSYVGQKVKVRGDFETGQAPPVQGANTNGSSSSSSNTTSTAASSGNTGATNTIATGGENAKTKATDHPGESFVVHHVDKLSGECNSSGNSGMSH
ncbi:MAG TPA: hypothetical protein VE994_16755 [Terriglobales bacterium]|nr:hypothetical protein [Terriglobales bacterium]